jgi:hypothetical protein
VDSAFSVPATPAFGSFEVPHGSRSRTGGASRGGESLGQAGVISGQARTIEMVFRAKLRRLEF